MLAGLSKWEIFRMPPCFCADCRRDGREQQGARCREHAKFSLHHPASCSSDADRRPPSPTNGSIGELCSWAATPEILSPAPMAGPGRLPDTVAAAGDRSAQTSAGRAASKHDRSDVVVDKLGFDFADHPLGETISDPHWVRQIMAITRAAGLTVATFAERPDLLREGVRPRDSVSGAGVHASRSGWLRSITATAGSTFIGTSGWSRSTRPNRTARSHARSVCRSPFAMAGSGREELPDAGWDAVIRWADEDRRAGRRPRRSVLSRSWWRRVCSGAASRG